MKKLYQYFKKQNSHTYNRGFILPFTMLIAVLVRLVTSSIMTVLSKQLYFGRVYKQSQAAYYAADDAIACAIAIDDTYQGSDGLGVFPSSTTTDVTTYINGVFTYISAQRLDAGLSPSTITREDVKCGQSAIFNPNADIVAIATSTNFYQRTSETTGIEYGITSTFTMRMPLGNGEFRCAKVTINKTPSFRQIISQGYARCGESAGSVERAVVNTTITEE